MNAAAGRKSNTILDLLTGLAGLAILGASLLAIDGRLRGAVGSIVTGHGITGDLGGSAARMSHTVSLVAGVLRDQSLSHAPLTVFSAAAIVLVLFMTRT